MLTAVFFLVIGEPVVFFIGCLLGLCHRENFHDLFRNIFAFEIFWPVRGLL